MVNQNVYNYYQNVEDNNLTMSTNLAASILSLRQLIKLKLTKNSSSSSFHIIQLYPTCNLLLFEVLDTRITSNETCLYIKTKEITGFSIPFCSITTPIYAGGKRFTVSQPKDDDELCEQNCPVF